MLPRKKRTSKIPAKTILATACGSAGAKKCTPPVTSSASVARGAGHFFNAGEIIATGTPVKRHYRARRGRIVVNFKLPRTDQFALLDLSVARAAFMQQRRLLLVHAADAMLTSGLCSLNACARLLGCPASWLCDLLKKFRAGGDVALLPKVQSSSAANACRFSFYFRTR